MEKQLYECQFYLKDKNGKKITDILTAYIETEYSYYATKLLIAIYANGNENRIWYSTPQTVKDPNQKYKELLFFDFQFQLIDEKGNKTGPLFNDLIIAKDWYRAEQLLVAKYADGDKKRIWHPTPHSYMYDELYKVNQMKLETFEFEFYLKDEKGKKISNLMTMRVDDWNYWKAEKKFVAAVAGGHDELVWHSTGHSVGLALPTIIRLEKEKEDRAKQEERDRKQAERIKAAVRFIAGKPAVTSETTKQADSNSKIIVREDQTVPNFKEQKTTKARIYVSRSEVDQVKGFLKDDEYIIVDEDTEESTETKNKKTPSSEKKKHPIQETLIFLICGFCGMMFLEPLKLPNDYRLYIAVAVLYPVLLIFIRRKLKLSRWTLAFFNIAACVFIVVLS